jgi:hypothetical protein
MSNLFKSYDTLYSDIIAYAQTAPNTGIIPSPFIDSSKVISSITTYNKTESDHVKNLIAKLVLLKDYYIAACGTGGIKGSTPLTPFNCQKAKSACEGIISILNAVINKYENRLKQGGKRQTRRHSKHNKNRKQNLKSRRHRNKQA